MGSKNTNKEGTMKALVVTTAHRGVFFGYGEPTDAPTIRLERARMCVMWPESLHGVIGLAVTGPPSKSRIGPACTSIILRDVTAVMEATEEAATKWEAEPWS